MQELSRSDRAVEQNPQFGKKSVQKIFDEYETEPEFCNLIAVYKDEEEREWLYVARENRIKVLKCEIGPSFEPTAFDHEFPFIVHRIALSCNFKYLSVTFDEPLVHIYQGGSLLNENLELLHKIDFTTSPQEALARNLKWNCKDPDEFCTLSSDNTVGLFSLKTMDFRTKKFHDLIILCIDWCYNNKLVVGCKSGNIVILNRNLTISRIIEAQDSNMGEVESIYWIRSMTFAATYYNPNDHYITDVEVDSNHSENALPNFYEVVKYTTVSQDKSEHPKDYIIYMRNGEHIGVYGINDNDGDSPQMINPVGLIIRHVPFKLAFHSDKKENTLKPFKIVHVLDTKGQLMSRELKYSDPFHQTRSEQGDGKYRMTKHCKDWRKKNTTGAAVERQQNMRNNSDSNGERKNHRRSTERSRNWRKNRRPIKCSPLESIDLYDPVGEIVDPFDLGI